MGVSLNACNSDGRFSGSYWASHDVSALRSAEIKSDDDFSILLLDEDVMLVKVRLCYVGSVVWPVGYRISYR